MVIATTGSSTSPPHPEGRCPTIRNRCIERWDEVRARRARLRRRGAARPARSAAPVPRPRQVFAIGMNYAAHAAEAGVERPGVPADVHEVPDVSHRARRHGRARRASSSTGRSNSSSSSAGAPTTSPRRRLVARRRPHGRPGPVRAHRADPAARAAVQPRQVVPRLRTDRPVGRHPRRGRRPRRSRDRVHRQRRRRAEEPHVRPDLRRRRADPSISSSITPLLPGDLIFTGTPSGVGADPHAAALPAPRRRARVDDRGHRHDSHPPRREERPP